MLLKHKHPLVLASLILTYSSATFASPGEVIGRSPDNTGGRLLGGWSAFLIGGAAAGPFGALAGAMLGGWAGDKTQAATQQSGNRYLVKTVDGNVSQFRSPNHTFDIGEKVEIDGIRIRPLTTSITE